MREDTRHCRVAAPAPVVWEFLSDYRNVVQLGSSKSSATLTSGTRGTAGATYAACLGWEGLESKFDVSLTEAEPPDSLVWSGSSGGVVCSMRFDLLPASRSTCGVTVSVILSMGSATGVLEPFGWALLLRMFDRLTRKLNELELDPVPE